MLSQFSNQQNDAGPIEAKQWIAGQWVEGESTEEKSDSSSPCERFRLLEGDSASSDQVESAITAAKSALKSWRRMSVDDRIAVVKDPLVLNQLKRTFRLVRLPLCFHVRIGLTRQRESVGRIGARVAGRFIWNRDLLTTLRALSRRARFLRANGQALAAMRASESNRHESATACNRQRGDPRSVVVRRASFRSQ